MCICFTNQVCQNSVRQIQDDCKNLSKPMEKGLKHSAKWVDLQTTTGSLIYLTISGPDLSFAVNTYPGLWQTIK